MTFLGQFVSDCGHSSSIIPLLHLERSEQSHLPVKQPLTWTCPLRPFYSPRFVILNGVKNLPLPMLASLTSPARLYLSPTLTVPDTA